MNRDPRLAQARADYLSGVGSLRDLAKKYGLSRRVLERRSRKEQWVATIDRLGGVTVAGATEKAREQGAGLAISVTGLIERSLKGAVMILDKIETELAKPAPDPSSLRALVSAWRDTIGVARLTHRMDEPAEKERPLVQIRTLNVAFAKERPPVTITAAAISAVTAASAVTKTKPNHHEPEPIDITTDTSPAASDNASPRA